MIAARVPSPKRLFKQSVEAATTAKKIMSPAIVIAQPVRNPWPTMNVAILPVIGSEPKAKIISEKILGLKPKRSMFFRYSVLI